MTSNHRNRLDRLEVIARYSDARSDINHIAEVSGIDPDIILAEAERLREQAGPFASYDDMLNIVAEEAGRTVEDLRADALQLMMQSQGCNT